MKKHIIIGWGILVLGLSPTIACVDTSICGLACLSIVQTHVEKSSSCNGLYEPTGTPCGVKIGSKPSICTSSQALPDPVNCPK